MPCQDCCPPYPITDDEAALPELYYYNPNSGKMLHIDPNCSAVSKTYLPQSGMMDADQAAASGISFYPVCASTAQPSYAFTYFDCFLPLEEQAALLTGVWTMPSEQSISQEDAYKIAKAYVYRQPVLMKKFTDGLFTVGVSHYNMGGAEHPEVTYKALVTTVLGQLVALVYLDAVSEKVYLCAWDAAE